MTQANKPSLPTKKKKGRLKEYRWPIAGVLFLLLLLAAFVIRLPYYIEMPGTAEDIRSVMTVDGKMDTKSGSYDFVTVAVKEATPADLIYAWATPFTDIYSAKDSVSLVGHRCQNRLSVNHRNANGFIISVLGGFEQLPIDNAKLRIDFFR